MAASLRAPVLVGVGQVSQRLEDPTAALEPLELMREALLRAEADAGAEGLLRRAEAIYVLKGVWHYGDPGRELCRRFGAAQVESIATPYGGNFSQACVTDAAREIAAGRRDVVLVTGGEHGRSRAQARRAGISPEYSPAPGTPDRSLGPDELMPHPAETPRGMRRATDYYAVFETALRAARGESVEAHAARIAELWAGFNVVACANPHAWIRKPYSAAEIGRVGPDNPMISYPYPRLMNANNRVDMGAGLIVCSAAAARELGVPEDRWVYLHSATDAKDAPTASVRWELHRSPAVRIAGRRALELAGTEVGAIDHFDVYSCFPSAVQVAAAELGIPEDRALTVTGGLTFGGGPLNDYTLHAIARMVEVLRGDRGARGLVTANGGYLSKHAFGVYSTQPPQAGFRYESQDLQAEIDALPRREAVVDWDGPVEIEAYTVVVEQGEPDVGIAACLTPDGVRTWGRTEDPPTTEAMMREEFCGRPGRIDGAGNLEV